MDVLDYVTENQYVKYAITGVVVTAATVFVAKNLTNILFGLFQSQPKVACPPGSVLLVQIPRGPHGPSLSPFPLKLETYLRINNIPYVTDVSGIMSDKGKTPWIMYNGEKVADSQICMEFLNKQFSKDMNKDLSKQDHARAEALRVMIDEHLYWCLLYFRWVDDQEKTLLKKAFKIAVFPSLLLRFVSGKMKDLAWAQGMGRHSPDEIVHILRSDLQVIADYLGNQNFIMGDSPCEVDCSAFGLLSQLLWQDSNIRTRDILREEFPTLASFCERMKSTYWPDWDQCTTQGGTQKATK